MRNNEFVSGANRPGNMSVRGLEFGRGGLQREQTAALTQPREGSRLSKFVEQINECLSFPRIRKLLILRLVGTHLRILLGFRRRCSSLALATSGLNCLPTQRFE